MHKDAPIYIALTLCAIFTVILFAVLTVADRAH